MDKFVTTLVDIHVL